MSDKFGSCSICKRPRWIGQRHAKQLIDAARRKGLPPPTNPGDLCMNGNDPRGTIECKALGYDLLLTTALKPRDVAAFLLDRADQYDTSSPCWVSLADAAEDVVHGEVAARESRGEFDDDLYARVDTLAELPSR